MTMLDPYLVVDMSDERGLFCGMVLGDLGADVVRIEPPGGNKARLVSPAGAGVAHQPRLGSGCGQHVAISAQDATSLAAAYQALATVLGSPPGKRSGGGIHVGDTSIPTIYQAADGIVSVTFFFGASQGPYSQRLMQWIYDEGECDEETRDKDYIDYLRQLKSGEEPMSELA